MAGKQYRLTVPKPEAEALDKQATDEGFETPQKFILNRLRRFAGLQTEHEQEIVDQREEYKGKLAETEASLKKQTDAVAKVKAERDDLNLKLANARSLPFAIEVVLRDDGHIEILCQKLHIRLIGNADFENAVAYMQELGGTDRHQDYVSRALRCYHVYKSKDVEGQLKTAESLIEQNADEIADLKCARDFYKGKSWLRKLWESLGGRKQLPPKPASKPTEDDDIPF